MPHLSSLVRTCPASSFHLASAAIFFALAASAHAQFSVPQAGTKVLDTSALHPPAGARVAIVEFADMECPACAKANPILKAAVAQYKIPWVRHDFLIPYHQWSPRAAVYARWFDSQSRTLGGDYRDQVFANQASIYNFQMLQQFTDNFARDHHVKLPFAIDPEGKLAAAVKADTDLGKRTGITQTPTVWIVTDHSKRAPYFEVAQGMTNLYQLIDQALADTAAPKAAPVKKPASK
ncbi:MAG: thioredoxin domain-containing protein [Terracidiphilus sp.]